MFRGGLEHLSAISAIQRTHAASIRIAPSAVVELYGAMPSKAHADRINIVSARFLLFLLLHPPSLERK